jgi:hypothetical protein
LRNKKETIDTKATKQKKKIQPDGFDSAAIYTTMQTPK